MTTLLNYKQLLIRYRKSGVAFVILNATGRNNILSETALQEFADAIKVLNEDNKVKAIGLISGKISHFCLGADLMEIYKAKDKDKIFNLALSGQSVFSDLTKLAKPIVVAVNGLCYGGGLELILCTDYRIASNSSDTQFSLPEVKLGLIPALGGTQRLAKIIGYKNALEMILTSSHISSDKAYEIGLIDQLVSSDDLISTLEVKLVDMALKHEVSSRSGMHLEDEKTILKLLNLNKRIIAMKLKGKYPAYDEVLACMETGYHNDLDAGLLKEREAFANLALMPQTKNQIFLSFTNEFANQQANQICTHYQTNKVANIGIIGTGLMGCSIANFALKQGLKVNLKSLRLSSDLERNRDLENIAKHPNLKIIHDTTDFVDSEVIIECVREDFALKVKVIKDILENTQSVVLSNTSSFKITDLASDLPDNSRFLGLHLFNPVQHMPLAEIIPHNETSSQSIATAFGLVKKMDKTAILVNDSPCFLMNRILLSYLLACCWCAFEGYALNHIEEAAQSFGMPIGPVALFDEIGMNLAFKAIDALVSYNVITKTMLPILIDNIKAIQLSGKYQKNGIYLYDDVLNIQGFNLPILAKLSLNISPDKPSPEILAILKMKLLLPMINEASFCLSEKIVKKAKEIDLACVLGMGFPAYHGGPLRFADNYGLGNVVKDLEKYSNYLVTANKISPLLISMANENKTFYTK